MFAFGKTEINIHLFEYQDIAIRLKKKIHIWAICSLKKQIIFQLLLVRGCYYLGHWNYCSNNEKKYNISYSQSSLRCYFQLTFPAASDNFWTLFYGKCPSTYCPRPKKAEILYMSEAHSGKKIETSIVFLLT